MTDTDGSRHEVIMRQFDYEQWGVWIDVFERVDRGGDAFWVQDDDHTEIINLTDPNTGKCYNGFVNLCVHQGNPQGDPLPNPPLSSRLKTQKEQLQLLVQTAWETENGMRIFEETWLETEMSFTAVSGTTQTGSTQ